MNTNTNTNRSVTVVNAVLHQPGGAAAGSADAVVVEDGVITFLGDSSTARQRTAQGVPVVDAGGRYLMPGLIETHGHVGMFAHLAMRIDCRPTSTPRTADVVAAVREAAANAQPGEWILGWGYDEHRMQGPGPEGKDLDEAAPDNPVFIQRTCAHMAVVNSAALASAGIGDDTPDPAGGRIVRDAAGRATGLLQEKATNLLDLPVDTPDQLLDGLRVAQREFAGLGLTTIHDMSSGPREVGAFQQLHEQDELTARFRPWYFAIAQGDFPGCFDDVIGTGLRSGFGDDMVRIQGLKFVLDGSVGGRTAAVEEPFENSDERGILYYETDEVTPKVAAGLRQGLRMAIHGIGDRAVAQALDLIEGAGRQVASQEKDPEAAYDRLVRSRRHRVEHCTLPQEEDLRRLVDSRILAASSTAFLYELGDSYLTNLGRERLERTYPMRTFLDRGITAPSNSDFPVTSPNPWFGIYACVTRTSVSGQVLDESQNITVAQALDAYTVEAAKASFEEDSLGRIAEGYLGDLVLLDRHPLDVPVEELKDVTALLTVCDGRIVHRADSI